MVEEVLGFLYHWQAVSGLRPIPSGKSVSLHKKQYEGPG